jgi:imidazolonepropionase-like amidohydrolase
MTHFLIHAGLILGVAGTLFSNSLCNIASAGDLAVTAGKIITVSGEPIEDGIIIIRDGKISEIGSQSDIDIPVELKVVAAPNGVVMPGFIDAHNSGGMSQANENNPVVPFLSVVDSIDPSREYFEQCRRNGITTASVVPGNSTLIGGQTAILKTAGGFVDDMLLRRVSGMKISLQPSSGGRMSHLAKLRSELDKAVQAIADEEGDEDDSDEADEEDESSDDESESDDDADSESKEDSSEDTNDDAAKTAEKKKQDDGLEAMKKVVRGELPVFLYCSDPMDIQTAKRLKAKYNLDIIYVLSQSTYEAFEQLRGADHPVIIDPTLVFWRTNPQTREDEKIVIPKLLMENEVPFIFETLDSASYRTYGNSYLWYQAATAVKYGMDEDKALAALTLLPAQTLGIEEFVGTLEVGKDADLVVLTGNPLDTNTWVEKTIVGGDVVYDKSDDEKIARLLSAETE